MEALRKKFKKENQGKGHQVESQMIEGYASVLIDKLGIMAKAVPSGVGMTTKKINSIRAETAECIKTYGALRKEIINTVKAKSVIANTLRRQLYSVNEDLMRLSEEAKANFVSSVVAHADLHSRHPLQYASPEVVYHHLKTDCEGLMGFVDKFKKCKLNELAKYACDKYPETRAAFDMMMIAARNCYRAVSKEDKLVKHIDTFYTKKPRKPKTPEQEEAAKKARFARKKAKEEKAKEGKK